MLKKMIITGASSMIGIALIEEAVRNGTDIYALIRPDTNRISRLPKSRQIHWIETDLENLASVEDIPKDCEVFYHFAWHGTKREDRENPSVQKKNIRYTLDAVELAARCGCRKFIGAGSQAEYGKAEKRIDDKTRCLPITAYGDAKFTAGILSRKKCDDYGMIHVWGRIFSVYGRHDKEGTMLDYAVRQFLNGEKAFFSSGTQMWDYLYEEDAGKIFYLLGSRCMKSSVYRIAKGESFQLREYIRILAEVMGCMHLCEFGSENNCLSLETAISDLQKDIGYSPDTPFEKGVAKMVMYYQAVYGNNSRT